MLFLKGGGPSRILNHARDQITDWKRYLEDNLPTVQRELGLTGISTNPRSLLVIGRSPSLSPENRRKLLTLENENPKLKIMTYDDVYENTKAVVENLMGPIWDVGGNTQIHYLRGDRP
ncbi:MAG: Shedu anti-phage system protein SduA domain-containing protein, partial [Thermodesulfobacteriota bacterium]